ncbi:cytochrome c oxidase cbb3-type subunit 2 [Prosthecobacter fusiformis]|uniref:Cytochrome c oxidase cbb3-type subunit 2 n=1 Tax=Prosthecobacter fusiformis TaxID=48464 RepID=A0A4R7SQT9_9BACT|nr:cbb3-type cytochrome c oxidase subunit II [Prosthecobacter fusiformis]TDU80979.1 cytochrome c oxidase cbb3-type subunit 2 [Prosthecobacter fusiformis]
MSQFRTFILALVASFGLPWLCLIVIPAVKYQALTQVAYDKDTDGIEGLYPPAPINRQGQLVYAREGCVQCHTQMIRPTQLALDGWRKGWGMDQDARPPAPVRSNNMRDYLGEPFAFLGVQRNGPDLSNYGWRAPERALIHQMLYAPRTLHDWSNMPAFTHLYKERLAQGPVSSVALKLPKKFPLKEGYEVIPTPEAEALVDYLLSLKKDYPVPGDPAAVAAAPAAAKK